MKTLEFKVPEKDAAVFATAVIETLDALEFIYDCDETSPPDENGITTYKVIGLEKRDHDY